MNKLPEKFFQETGAGDATFTAPSQITSENSLDEILAFARMQEASDVHLCVNNPIVIRKFGKLLKLSDVPLKGSDVETILKKSLSDEIIAPVIKIGDVEFVHTIKGLGRYRVTILKQRFGWDLTARIIPQKIRTFSEACLPESCKNLTKWAQGLILVAGPAGCGKTSTLATLVQHINENRNEHIITIEDPIEIVFESQKCQITQREINRHTLSQDNALRAALREDPDIIVVSELRDLKSIQLAVTAAETGHLVLGTMNTNNVSQTVSTLIDSFPPDERSIITNMISQSLRGVICQQMIERKDGTGLVPAYEVLVVNMAISNMIRTGNTSHINNAITIGKKEGMILFDTSLQALIDDDIIEGYEAYIRAINPKAFERYAHPSTTGEDFG